MNTAAARSSADNELSHGGQNFAERQSIQMNTAAARSTAVIIVVDSIQMNTAAARSTDVTELLPNC